MKIGIITDIHENSALLTDALRLASDLKCDELACLGDIAGYDRRFFNYDSQRSASECLRLIRENCRWITAGNHDLFAAGTFPSWSNGFTYPSDWFTMDPDQRKKISSGKVWCYEGDSPNDLTEEDIEFMRNIPEFIITDEPGIPCLFSHYFSPDYTGSTTIYIERKGQMEHHWNILSKNDIKYSFTGHSHNNFISFAYRPAGLFMKPIQSFPGDIFYLGNEMTVMVLPPLSGEKGKQGFTILDTEKHQVKIISSL